MTNKPYWSWFSLFILGILMTESQMEVRWDPGCGGVRTPASSCDSWQAELLTVDDEDEIDRLYDEMKVSFEASSHCSPSRIFNDPSERLSPILFHRATRGLTFITRSDTNFTKDLRLRYFKGFAEDYSLSPEATEYGLKLISEQNETPSARYEVLQRVRGEVLKDLLQASKARPDAWDELLRDELVAQKIFAENEQGEIVCPFVSKDAFQKALKGRAQAITRGLVPKTDLLTIIDFSRPSNERRMFVFDLKKKKVLHNTWSAHGGGASAQTRRTEEAGVDGFGSSPTMSNKPGMSYSSEGFYLASGSTNHWNNTYGPNVILKGLDVNNTNLQSRAVVLHGWRTPYHEYVSGPWVWDEAKNKRLRPEDQFPKFMALDFKTASVDEMDEALDKLSSAATPKAKRLETTNGCLGVPQGEVEPLMKILPGSLMFNYTGPGMTSKFLN